MYSDLVQANMVDYNAVPKLMYESMFLKLWPLEGLWIWLCVIKSLCTHCIPERTISDFLEQSQEYTSEKEEPVR